MKNMSIKQFDDEIVAGYLLVLLMYLRIESARWKHTGRLCAAGSATQDFQPLPSDSTNTLNQPEDFP